MFVYQDDKIIDLDTGKAIEEIVEETRGKKYSNFTKSEKLAKIFVVIFYEDESLELFGKYLEVLINFFGIKDKPEKIDDCVNIILNIQNSSEDLIDFIFFDIITYEDEVIFRNMFKNVIKSVFEEFKENQE